MKKILLLALIISCYSAFAQKKPIDYFKEGSKYYKKGDFKTADSLFTIADSLNPNVETFFNHAKTKKAQGNICGYCKYLDLASNYNDDKSKYLFKKDCVKEYVLYYKSDSSLFKNQVQIFNLCNHDTLQSLFKITKKDTILVFKSVENYHGFLMGKFEISGKDSSQIILNIDTNSISNETARIQYSNFKTYYKQNNKPYSSMKNVHALVEKMPEYPGGEEARVRLLQNNMWYPQYAKENGIQGTVYVSFIIDENGNVSDVILLRGIGGGCNEEAIRVVKLMPKWIPGTADGFPVKVQFNMPIRFTLN